MPLKVTRKRFPHASVEHRELRKSILGRDSHTPKPVPAPQPVFRPISGYNPKWGMPKIKKIMMPLRPIRHPNDIIVKFTMSMTRRERNQLRKTARELGISSTIVLLLAFRRFVRKPQFPPKPDAEHRGRRVNVATLQHRAEDAAFGPRSRGPAKEVLVDTFDPPMQTVTRRLMIKARTERDIDTRKER